jgi:hypothetical protein
MHQASTHEYKACMAHVYGLSTAAHAFCMVPNVSELFLVIHAYTHALVWILQAGAIQPLVAMLYSDVREAQLSAAGALQVSATLGSSLNMRILMQQVHTFITHTCRHSVLTVHEGCGSCVACHINRCQSSIDHNNRCQSSIGTSKHDCVYRNTHHVSCYVQNLCVNVANKKTVASAGGIEALMMLLSDKDRSVYVRARK